MQNKNFAEKQIILFIGNIFRINAPENLKIFYSNCIITYALLPKKRINIVDIKFQWC